MTPNEYQQLALRTRMSDDIQVHRIVTLIEENPPLSQIIVAGAKLSSESGELNDAIVNHISYGQPLDKLNIKEECGDLLWYIAVILNSLGFSIEQTMKDNIEKLRVRYPDKFTEEHAAKRLDKVEENYDTTDFPTKPCRQCGKKDRPQYKGTCNDAHCDHFE